MSSATQSSAGARRAPAEMLYLALAVLGAILPLAAFLPWLAEYGPDVPLFGQELFANRISSFFGWDVIVSAIVVIVAVAACHYALTRRQQAIVIVATLLVGVSLSLPLLLYFGARQPDRASR
jgi:Terpene cyclase DEP1